MLLVLDQREWLCSISKKADFGFSFSSDCWFRTERVNGKKVVEPMGLSLRWQKIAKLHNKKSIWKRKIKNTMLTLWIWYCKEEMKQSGIAYISLEWILKGGREFFIFFSFSLEWMGLCLVEMLHLLLTVTVCLAKLFLSAYFTIKLIFVTVGAKNLSLCVGLKVSFFNNNASEEKKAWGKAP